jgi:hypothetical protein
LAILRHRNNFCSINFSRICGRACMSPPKTQFRFVRERRFPCVVGISKTLCRSPHSSNACKMWLLNRAGKFANVLSNALDQRSRTACSVNVLAHHDSSARTRCKIGPIIESMLAPRMEAHIGMVPRTNIVGAPAGVIHISALLGRVKQKLAPRGELSAAHKRPPSDSTMERLIRSPMPVP